MNERQTDEIINRVLTRILEEYPKESCMNGFANSLNNSRVNSAYVFLSQDFAMNRQPLDELIRKLGEDFTVTAIVPGAAISSVPITGDLRVSDVLSEDDAAFPSGEFLTVFLGVSRTLVVKTALCIADDFNSMWVARCLANGLPVSMFRNLPLFTGKESHSYKSKIQSYYREAESYGVLFDRLPQSFGAKFKTERSCQAAKRIITVDDLQQMDSDTLELRAGDIITTLARERANELGIRVSYTRERLI